MKKIYFDEIESTQLRLIDDVKNNKIKIPICYYSDYQTQGIGSRGNSWIGKRGNLFFSFAYKKEKFSDIPLQSLSIYFGWIFKKTLNELGSNAIMKWPNDIYLDKKIGGVITNIICENIICGIGLNTQFSPSKEFSYLDIEIKNDKILNSYFENLAKNIKWKNVIDEFKEEFKKTKELFNINGKLLDDGSLEINKKRIYSRR